jgi:hypothetical protein
MFILLLSSKMRVHWRSALPNQKRHHLPPTKYHFLGRLFSDLVQFLLRNFAKESKASLKAFVGGIHEQGNTL